jgi:D-aminoacyl-tRNA deacylase
MVNGKVVGRCGAGLLLLVGVKKEDDSVRAAKLAKRVVNLRIFNDPDGKMNLSILDLRGEGTDARLLAVSNFTVYGDADKSRRPSFTLAAPYEEGRILFEEFVSSLRSLAVPVETGEYGAHMEVRLLNDGPVTLVIDV